MKTKSNVAVTDRIYTITLELNEKERALLLAVLGLANRVSAKAFVQNLVRSSGVTSAFSDEQFTSGIQQLTYGIYNALWIANEANEQYRMVDLT